MNPIGYKRDGLTVSTVGLLLRGLSEIRIDVNSVSLVEESGKGWREQVTPIAFAGRKKEVQPRKLGPMEVKDTHYGTLFQRDPENQNLSIGGYAGVGKGLRSVGAGGYLTLNWNACK
jgi:hypothetical protein